MKKKHIKWLIIIAISGVLVLSYHFCSSAKAESEAPVVAEPTPAPTPYPSDFWNNFEYPDWAESTFDLETTSPITPEPTGFRELDIPDDLTGLSEIVTSTFTSKLVGWSSFYVDGDTSVIYFRSHLNQQIAVSTSQTWRIGYPWEDSASWNSYSNGDIDFKSGTTAVQLTRTRTEFDASYGDYNISWFDAAPRSGGDPIIGGTSQLVYFFALNNTYPKIYNAPSWFAEAGITDELLLNAVVSPFAYVRLLDGTTANFSLDPFYLQDFYAGKTFVLDCESAFAGDLQQIETVAFNFRINYYSSFVVDKYRDYLAANPQITGHVPFYVYFENPKTSAPFYAMKLQRYSAYSKTDIERNWWQKLLMPDPSELASIFENHTPDVGNGTSQYVIEFKQSLYNLVANASGNDAIITMPSIQVPIAGRQYTIANSYTFNFTQTLRDIELYTPLRLTMTFIVTCAFINGVISMVVTVFDIKWFDGVRGD